MSLLSSNFDIKFIYKIYVIFYFLNHPSIFKIEAEISFQNQPFKKILGNFSAWGATVRHY